MVVETERLVTGHRNERATCLRDRGRQWVVRKWWRLMSELEQRFQVQALC